MKFAVTVTAMIAASCLIDRRTSEFSCGDTADCEAPRMCVDGFCIIDPDFCPPECTECRNTTCIIDCQSMGDCGDITCPAGMACEVDCRETGACGAVACGSACSCDVDCHGDGCASFTCPTTGADCTRTGNDGCDPDNSGCSTCP